MPKIKNWTKTKDSRYKELWEHDETGGVVGLDTRRVDDPRRYVAWSLTGRPGIEELNFLGDNKKEARQKAIKWMRRHP